MLYATTPSSLYSFNTLTSVASTLASAPTNTVFRGVAAAPYDVAPVWPACIATPTNTPSPSTTPAPNCAPSIWRTLLNHILDGDFIANALDVPTARSCQLLTCGTPSATAYTWNSATLQCAIMANATTKYLDPAYTTTSGVLWSVAPPVPAS